MGPRDVRILLRHARILRLLGTLARPCANYLCFQGGEADAVLANYRTAAMNAERPQPDAAASGDASPPPDPTTAAATSSMPLQQGPREIGGRGGLEPTRYGDWEKSGRCIDF
jgi:hypothetical protein